MIKQITIDELPQLLHLASKFYSRSTFLKGFNPEVWTESWTMFMQSGIGVIFGLFSEDAICHGALGALRFPDISGGFLIATEAFWFTEESHKGKGIYLMKAYEKWAKSQECKRIAMSYLADSMPDEIKNIYERFGYKLSEITYMKEVV